MDRLSSFHLEYNFLSLSLDKRENRPTMRPSTELPPFKPKINKLHTIYPAMGKRSIPSDSRTWREKFYLDHHRSTRHELYAIIEKYLFAWVWPIYERNGKIDCKFFFVLTAEKDSMAPPACWRRYAKLGRSAAIASPDPFSPNSFELFLGKSNQWKTIQF